MSRKTLYFVSFAAAVVLFAASLSLGVAKFSWAELFSGSLNGSAQIMIASRLPRTFALVLTGASMAVAGMIMQILLKNRFVEPSMVGASQSGVGAGCRADFVSRSRAAAENVGSGGMCAVGDAAVYGAYTQAAAHGAAFGAAGGHYLWRGD